MCYLLKPNLNKYIDFYSEKDLHSLIIVLVVDNLPKTCQNPYSHKPTTFSYKNQYLLHPYSCFCNREKFIYFLSRVWISVLLNDILKKKIISPYVIWVSIVHLLFGHRELVGGALEDQLCACVGLSCQILSCPALNYPDFWIRQMFPVTSLAKHSLPWWLSSVDVMWVV